MHLLMKLLIFISSIFIFEIQISNAVYETGSTSNSNSNDQKEKGKAAASSTTLTEIEEEETTLSDSNLITNLSDLKTVERFSLRDIVSPEDEENIFPRWCDLMVDDLKSIDKKNAGNHQTMDIKEYIKEISTYEFIKDILDKIKLLEEITTELYEYNKNGQRNYVFTQNFINSMENFAEFLKLEKIDSNSNDKVKAIEKLLVNRINFNKFYEILEGLQKIQILRGIWSCGTNLPQAMIAFINNFKIDLIFGQIYNYNYFSKMDERIEKYKQEINKKIEPAEKLLNKKSKAEEEYKQLEEKKEKEQKRILAKLRSFTFNKENEEEKRLKVKSLEIEKIESEMQKFENDRKLTPAAYKNLLIKYKNLNEASLELFKGLIVEIAQKIKENVPKDSIIIDDGKLFLGQKLKKIFAQIEPLIGTMHGARNQQPQRRQEEIIPDTVVNVPPGRNQNPLTVMRSSLLANDVPVDAENAGYTWLDYIEYHLLFPETWRNEESHKISMKTNYSDLRLKIRLNAGILLVAFERIKEFIEFRGKK